MPDTASACARIPHVQRGRWAIGALPPRRPTSIGRSADIRFNPRLPMPVAFRAEDSPRGLWRSLGKRVGFTPSRVRIPHPPPLVSKGNRRPDLTVQPAVLWP